MIAIIIFTILCILSIVALWFLWESDFKIIIMLTLCINYSLLAAAILEYMYIPAIEVYRGNTELEITYKNNIPIDSIVIWKQK